MSSSRSLVPPEVFFLPARAGYRFCIFHPPQGRSTQRGCVLYVHPFGEEMNKSRRMASMQSRRLAASGIGVLQLDLLGCGDSSGSLGDATWDDWKDDLQAGMDWLAQRAAGPLRLWGLRLGAVLALDFALSRRPAVRDLLLWQPVVSGEQFLTQFLRLSMAGGLTGAGPAANTAELRRELAAGKTLWIAGYALNARLAHAMSGLRLADLAPVKLQVDVLEITSGPQGEPSQALGRALSVWRSRGCDVGLRTVQGDPFWSTVEIAECSALLDATLEVVERRWVNVAQNGR